MYRYILIVFTFFLNATIFANNFSSVTVGIVIPMQHQALSEIVAGFQNELTKEYPGKITFIVKNAQGDINIQRAILQEFKQSNDVKVIVPVATATLQMAASIIKDKPIIGLAVEYTEQQRQQQTNKNVTAVDDEIGSIAQVNFIHKVMPNLHKITIIHSASDKIIPEVTEFVDAAKFYNITVQELMVQQLSDLYTASTRIANDSQAIFVLKDNLIASGVNTLVKVANKNYLPLISSDNGTVENGAAFALGVNEYDIGAEGAKLANKVLIGKDISTIPVIVMNKLHVFVNTNAAKQQKVNLANVQTVARSSGYSILALGR